MLLRGSPLYDNRVRREAASVAKLGHEVIVLVDTGGELPPAGDGVAYRRLPRSKTRRQWAREASRSRSPLVRAVSKVVRAVPEPPRWWRASESRKRIVFWLRARPVLAELRPDVVHAHDLKTLLAGARYDAKLVYDAHELEVYSLRVRSRLQRLGAWLFERYGIRRADAVITVGDEVAEEIARIHGVAKPFVVFNAPPLGDGSRSEALRALGERVVVYTGGAHGARGTGALVDALALLPPAYHLAIVGPRNAEDDAPLLARGDDRLHLLPPVPGDDLVALIAGADVAAIPIANACRSYDLSMPNKLFEAVQAGLPIAVSERKAMARFVREHRLGAVFDERDPASIAAAIQEARADPEELREVQRRYSWEAQEPVLAAVYAKVLG